MRARASHALGAFEPSRLEVRWQRRGADIFENLRVALWGPRGVWGLQTAESFFRLRMPPARRRGWQLTGSLVCHAFLLFLVLATSQMALPPARLPLPEVHITWYGPPRDVVPKIAPLPKRPQLEARERPGQPRQKMVTRAYNPNSTLVFQPPHATSRRQLLIEPQAPPQLPGSLPAMPNIIQWEAGAPARPEIAIQPNQLRAVRGKGAEQAHLRAPQITYQAQQRSMDMLPNSNAPVAPPSFPAPRGIRGVRAASRGEAGAAAPALVKAAPVVGGDLAFAGSKDAAPAPPLPVALGAIRATRAASSHAAAQGSPAVGTGSLGPSTLHLAAGSGDVPPPPLTSSPNAVRAQSSKGAGSSAAVPSIGLAAGSGSLVSLSLSPGADPPPPGNAYAPMSIGPHPGRKGLSANHNSVGSGGSGEGSGFPAPEGSATGPEGLLILHDANPPAPPPVPQPSVSARSKPARGAPGPVAAAVPRRPVPVPGPSNAEVGHGLLPLSGPISVAHNVLLIGVIVQDLANKTIGPWSMPSLAMNLPKLSSSRGTWVLDFADPMPSALREQNKVIVPLPVHAVEPEYPAALRQKGVRGKVVLHALIGSNGKVSQVRVTQGLNPVLDQMAKAAFSRWKFEPALLNDKPIAMPVIVTVPFRYTPAPH